MWNSTGGFLTLLAWGSAVIGFFEIAGRRAAQAWSVEMREKLTGDDTDVTVLDIGRVVHGAHVGG